MIGAILHRVYLTGYTGWVMPRLICKAIAGSELHRAWYLGYTGHFTQNGVRYGLDNPYNPGPWWQQRYMDRR